MLNIWEVLGLETDHRKPTKILKVDVEGEFEFPLRVMKEVNGMPCILLCFSGVFYIFNTQGKQLKNTKDLLTKIKFSTDERHDFLILGSLCIDRISGELVAKIVNPQRKNPIEEYSILETMHLAMLDIYPVNEFIKGEITLPWSIRTSNLRYLIGRGMLGYRPFDYYVEDESVLEELGSDYYKINNKANFLIGEDALLIKEVVADL